MAGKDWEISTIKQEHWVAYRDREMWAIIELPDGFGVYWHNAESVGPLFMYPTKRLAASRILQLLGIGPVAPQDHPENICVGTVTLDDGGLSATKEGA